MAQNVELFQVSSPDLQLLAVGDPELLYLEGLGFSSDDEILLVRASFTDSGDRASGLKYGFFVYDVTNRSYLASVNALLAGDQNVDAVKIDKAVLTGSSADWKVFVTTVSSEDQSRTLSLLNSSGVEIADVVNHVAGEPFSVPIEGMKAGPEGRFLAIQTSDGSLADLPLDTNDSPDIYLLDLLERSVVRVSLAGGAGVLEPTYLEDMKRSGDGTLQVLFSTDAPFVNPKQDGNAGGTDPLGARDLYQWQASLLSEGGLSAPNITLVSKDNEGLALGHIDSSVAEAQLSSGGVFFSTASALYDEADGNESLDAFIASGDAPIRVGFSGSSELDRGSTFIGADNRGLAAYVLSDASELGATLGSPQLYRVLVETGEVVRASAPDSLAPNNAAIDGVVGQKGNLLAFTSLATNLVDEESVAPLGNLFISQLPSLQQPIEGRVYHWANHAQLAGVTVSLTEGSGDSSEVLGVVQTDGAGPFSLEASLPSSGTLSASLSLEPSSVAGSVNILDAIAALKIAVGLNPNADPDGSGPLTAPEISPYQLIAADVNNDGRVNIVDAIEILKMAVGLSTAIAQEWRFISQAETFWDEASGNFTVDERNLTWAREGLAVAGESPADASFVAVLTGDVNASWGAPLSATGLDRAYFESLSAGGYGPLEKWQLFPIA